MSATDTPPSRPTAGAWLTRQMERRSIGVQQLADALGVTGKTIYYWRDDKATVSEERIPRLAEVLGLTEIATRRGLGYWVPKEHEVEPADRTREELATLREELQGILDRIDRLQD